MIRALVFDTDSVLQPSGQNVSVVPAYARMAGLTLSRRAVLSAWRAGAGAATVIRSTPGHRTRRSGDTKPPIPVDEIAGDAASLVGDAELLLVLSAQIVPRGDLLERLLESAEGTGHAVAAVTGGSACYGAAALPAINVAQRLARGESLGDALRAELRAADRLLVEDQAYWLVETPEALAGADRRMYEGLTSVTDGYIDRVFNRHISRWFTRLVIDLPVTPNQVTWFHFTLGLLAAWLFWQGQYWQDLLGAAVFQLSVALDCSDGEIARLKFQYSRFGSWLDVWADNVVNIAIFAAIAKAAAVELGPSLGMLLGALAVSGVVMCVLVVAMMARLQERLRPGEASRLAVTNRLSGADQAGAGRGATLVDVVINEATSRDFSVLVVLFAVLGQLDWFAWLAGIGSHVFWIVFGVIQLSMLRTADAKSR